MASFSPEEYFHKVDNMVLISCQCLRKLFQTRWKRETGKTWEHTEEQGKAFCEGEGKFLLKLTKDKSQKGKILKGCLDDWDMTTLSLVLRNFGDPTSYKDENEAVERLKKMRNDVAHHSTKAISVAEYKDKVELFQTCLQTLKVGNKEIDKIIEKAGSSSSEAALEATKKLYAEAEEYLKKEDFDNALKCFDEVTTIQSLLPVHQGGAYEKRGEYYLNLAHKKKENKEDGDKCCAQAILDANAALELNESSWNAHYLLAQCYRWQRKLEKAMHHFDTALAISPGQKHVKKDLHSCKSLLGLYERQDNIDARQRPMTLGERVAHLEAETGRKQTEEEFLTEQTQVHGMLIEGQDDVFRGHQYIMGWSVEQSDEQAFRFYENAANVGNPEGIYNLGLCYARPKGVKQDLSKAYQLYLRAANMSPITPGVSTNGVKNVGVAAAQHSLGLMYHEGVHVERDYCEAVIWYTKAMENGMGNSANNLALMYANGTGVPRNEKKAEMYWNQAVIYKDGNAAASLVYYYIKHMEPEKARTMFEIAKQLRSVELNGITEEDFNNMLDSKLDRTKYEEEVIAYEQKLKLDTKGMTVLERLQRYLFTKDPKMGKLHNQFEEIGKNKGWGGSFSRRWDSEFFEQLARLAHYGSSTADRVLRTFLVNLKLADFIDDKKTFNGTDKIIILNFMYEWATLQLSTGQGMYGKTDGKEILKQVIGQLFDEKCDGRKCEDDMKIRFSYVFFNKLYCMKTADSFMEELLKQGIRMYPENVYYYDLLSSLYGNSSKWESALEWAEKGLKKFSDNVDLLYSKAVHIRQLPESRHEMNKFPQDINQFSSGNFKDRTSQMNEEMKKAIPAYKEFLYKAPFDHRKVPEAYYALANLHIYDSLRYLSKTKPEERSSSPSFRKLEHYYKMGKEAEQNMLPCYLPYGESDIKKFVELIISFFNENGNNHSRPYSLRNSVSSSDSSFINATCEPQSAAPIKSILEKKQYLSNPVRKGLIIQYRQKILTYKTIIKRHNLISIAGIPKLKQTSPMKMSGVKPITLQEMNPTVDHIYENRMIDLKIIENPCVYGFQSVHLLAEDENGDVTRLYLYNVETNKETEKLLGHGATIAILNPYMRIGSQDMTNGIRNDDLNCLIYLEKVEKMCRFCGDENAVQSCCSKCKEAWYCSEECRELDLSIMKHDFICSSNIK